MPRLPFTAHPGADFRRESTPAMSADCLMPMISTNSRTTSAMGTASIADYVSKKRAHHADVPPWKPRISLEMGSDGT